MCMITEYRLPRRVANYAGVNACGRCRANVSLCLFAAGSGVFRGGLNRLGRQLRRAGPLG